MHIKTLFGAITEPLTPDKGREVEVVDTLLCLPDDQIECVLLGDELVDPVADLFWVVPVNAARCVEDRCLNVWCVVDQVSTALSSRSWILHSSALAAALSSSWSSL